MHKHATASSKRCHRGLEVQSLIFPGNWSTGRAKSWALVHGFRATKSDVTSQSVRLRQRPPRDFVQGSFRTIAISRSERIRAVVGCPKPGKESDKRLRRASAHDVERVAQAFRDLGYRAKVLSARETAQLQRSVERHTKRRDVSRYDLSPDAKAWLHVYHDEGATPDVRRRYESLSRFDKAAIQFLLEEDSTMMRGRGARDKSKRKVHHPIRHEDGSVDRRFTIAQEYSGHEVPQYAVRFNGRWVGASATLKGAERLAHEYNRARFGSSRDPLSTRKRKSLRASQFALPSARKFPIHDAAHARNAATRLEQARRRGTISRSAYVKARARIRRAEKRFGIRPGN